jgi:hypothetical protein
VAVGARAAVGVQAAQAAIEEGGEAAHDPVAGLAAAIVHERPA